MKHAEGGAGGLLGYRVLVLLALAASPACASLLGIEDPVDRVGGLDATVEAGGDAGTKIGPCRASTEKSCRGACVPVGNATTGCSEPGCDPCTPRNYATAMGCGADGGCTIAGCMSGRADCDGIVANGCETDTKTAANCGSCSRACDGGFCEQGNCVAACTAPRSPCGTSCVDLATDPDNCKTCGTACPSQNGIPACKGGSCTIACKAGFEHCTGNPLSGCETPVNTTTNCGGCAGCTGAGNATSPNCVTGPPGSYHCEYTCLSDFSDCMHSPVSMTTTGCGCSADAGTCDAGLCMPSCQAAWQPCTPPNVQGNCCTGFCMPPGPDGGGGAFCN